MKIAVSTVLAVLATILLCAAAAAPADEKPIGWTTTANISGVFTGGNAAGSSFGLKARTERNWSRAQYFLEGGGIRQTATDTTRYAVGAPSDFTVTETEIKNTKAENYFVETGFQRRINERVFWDLGGGFKRDLFSGIEQLWSGRAGMGYAWTDGGAQNLKLGLAATVNHQQEKVQDPATKDTFVGARFAADYVVKFGTARQSQFASKLALDENLQVTEDFRSSWDNSLTVSVNRRLALQLGGKWDFRNMPALQQVPLFAAPPAAGAGSPVTVLAPYKKSDVWLTVSFVLNWAPAAKKPAP
jgi:hypothetical protein